MFPSPIINQYGNNLIGAEKVKKMMSNQDTVYALYKNGNLYAMGANTYGTFGDGSTASSAQKGYWTLVNTNVNDIYTGDYCAIIQYNDLTWAYTGWRRIVGLSSSTDYVSSWTTFSSFTYFANNSLVIKEIQVGATAIGVLCTNGSLYQMGYQSQGNFGIGNTQNYSTFVLSSTNVVSYVIGGVLTYIIKTDGLMYRAGWNQYGQQANGSTSNVTTFTSTSIAGVKAIQASGTNVSYINSNNIIYTTGQRSTGIVTGGTSGNQTSFVQGDTGLSTGYVCTLNKLDKDGGQSIFGWNTGTAIYRIGANSYGQLGIGNSTAIISTLTAIILPVPMVNIVQIRSTSYASYMLCTNNQIYACGLSTAYSGYTTNQSTFVLISLPA